MEIILVWRTNRSIVNLCSPFNRPLWSSGLPRTMCAEGNEASRWDLSLFFISERQMCSVNLRSRSRILDGKETLSVFVRAGWGFFSGCKAGCTLHGQMIISKLCNLCRSRRKQITEELAWILMARKSCSSETPLRKFALISIRETYARSTCKNY